MTGPLVLAYDGSPDAAHALRRAGELLAGPAIVVHVYATAISAPPPPPPLAAGLALPIDPIYLDDPAVTEELDARARERAAAVAAEGVELARAAGFDAAPRLVPGDGAHGVWTRLAPPSVGPRATSTPAATGRPQITPSRSPAT